VCRRRLDLIVAADRAEVVGAAQGLRDTGANVKAVQADLATAEGVDQLYKAIDGRVVDALLANAGHGLGGGFLDQDFDEVRHVPAEQHRKMAEPGSGVKTNR